MRYGVLSMLLVIIAPAAAAQPGPSSPPPAQTAAQTLQGAQHDAIADILDRSVPLSKDEDEPDTVGKPRVAADIEPGGGGAPGVQQRNYSVAPRSQLDAPVHIDDLSRTPDGPLTARDLAYDARIRSSFASAESFLGPLDGGWMLSADGQDLFALQLVDRRDRLEGVWRDLRRKGALNASGLVDNIQRQGSELTLRFSSGPDTPTNLAVLHDNSTGIWTGELLEAGARRAVTLRRTGP